MIASCRNFFFDKILFYTYCFALNFSSLNFYFVFNSFFFFQIFVDTNRLNNCLENRIVNFLPPLSMRSFRVTRNTARMDKIFRLYRRKFYRSKKCFFYHFRFIKLFRITEKYKMNTQLKLFKNSTVTTGTFLPHSFLLSHKILHRNWAFLIGGFISPYTWSLINQRDWLHSYLNVSIYKNRKFQKLRKPVRKFNQFARVRARYVMWQFRTAVNQRNAANSPLFKKIFLKNFFYLNKCQLSYKNLKFLHKLKIKKFYNHEKNWFLIKPYLFLNIAGTGFRKYPYYLLDILYKKYSKLFFVLKKIRLKFWRTRAFVFKSTLWNSKSNFTRRFRRKKHFWHFKKKNRFAFFLKKKINNVIALFKLQRKFKRYLKRRDTNKIIYAKSKHRLRWFWFLIFRNSFRYKKRRVRKFVKRIRSRNRFKYKAATKRRSASRRYYKLRLTSSLQQKLCLSTTPSRSYLKFFLEDFPYSMYQLKRRKHKKPLFFYNIQSLLINNKKTFRFIKKRKLKVFYWLKPCFKNIFKVFTNTNFLKNFNIERWAISYFIPNFTTFNLKLLAPSNFLTYALLHKYKYFNHPIFFTRTNLNFILKRHGFLFITEPSTNSAHPTPITTLRKHMYSFTYKHDLHRYVLKRYTKRYAAHDIPAVTSGAFLQFNDAGVFNLNESPSIINFFTNFINSTKHMFTLSRLMSSQILATSNTFLLHQIENWKSFVNEDWDDLNIKRVRFKPGYATLWRNARQAIKISWNLKFRYQHRLTTFLAQFTKQIRTATYLMFEMYLSNVLLKTRLLPDVNSVQLFLQNGLVFVNGYECLNEKFLLKLGDFVQFIVSIKYYIVYRWLINWELRKKSRLKKLAWRKAQMRFYSDEKQKSTHLPNWILSYKNSFGEVVKYVELDHFTLSFMVIYEPFLWTDINFYHFTTIKFGIINLYNWKYIT